MATIKLNRALVLDTYGFHAVNEIVEVADEHLVGIVSQHGSDVSVISGPATGKKGKPKDTPPPEEESQKTAEETQQSDPPESDITTPPLTGHAEGDTQTETTGAATTGTVGSVPNLTPNHKR